MKGADISVSTRPGAIALTLMLSSINSTERLLTILLIPAFVIPYTPIYQKGSTALMLEVSNIFGFLDFLRSGRLSFIRKKADFRLTL